MDPQFRHELWQRLVATSRTILFEEIMTEDIWHNEWRQKLLDALESERDAMYQTYKTAEVELELVSSLESRDR